MRPWLVGAGLVLAGCAHVQTRALDARAPRDVAAPVAVLDRIPRGGHVVATMVADGEMSRQAFLDGAAAAARRVGADALVVSLTPVQVKGSSDGEKAVMVVGFPLVVVILLPLTLLEAVAGGAGGFDGLGGFGPGLGGSGLEWRYAAKAMVFGTGDAPPPGEIGVTNVHARSSRHAGW